jgi:uncharacterized membrane protein YgcG
MIRFKYLPAALLTIALLLVSNALLAFTPPPAPIPPKSYVADVANKLSSSDLLKLNSQINKVNRSSANEIAVLIIQSLENESIPEVAHTTFNTWKVGKKGLDNGILIVIAVDDKRSRIEVGRGVEGDLTDLQSNDIIRTKLNPLLKSGDFYTGLSDTIDAISKTIESRKGQKVIPPSAPAPTNLPTGAAGCSVSEIGINDGGVAMFSFIFFIGFMIIVYLIWKASEYKDGTSHYYSTPPTPPPPPVTTPRRRRSDVPTYGHITPLPKEVYYPPYRPSSISASIANYSPPEPYVAPVPEPIKEEESDYVAPVIAAVVLSSLFESNDDSRENSYSPPEEVYSPPSSDSVSDDTGFSGGESDGGGSDESW